MKKIDKRLIVFIIVAVIVAVGICNKTIFAFMGNSLNFISTKDELTFKDKVKVFDKATEKIINENISYRYEMVDLNSIFLRCAGYRCIVKENDTIVRLNNNQLVAKRDYTDDETINGFTDKIKNVYEASKAINSQFLFVAAPEKGYDEELFPYGLKDYLKSNYDRYLNSLKEKDIPYLDLIGKMKEEGISDAEMFFNTDHHWRGKSMLWGAQKLSEELKTRYGFEYNNEYLNFENYVVKTINNVFLGSGGRIVGQYFTPLGLDDADILIPKFETSLSNIIYKDNTIKRVEGSFFDSMVFFNECYDQNVYLSDIYGLYGGSEYYKQYMKNNLNPEGKKVLIVKDSFGRAMAPFLSLVTGEIYEFDFRAKKNEDKSIYDYINELKPDYIIVMFTNLSEDADRYQF